MPKQLRPNVGRKLSFMTDQAFEDETTLLLAEYGRSCGQVIVPPIPVDEIVELYLKLTLELIDSRKLFGVDDVHGALWVNERRVGIDLRLDPATYPAMLGRYRFTLAHEAGHWRLHRQHFQKSANQLTLLPENAERPEYICRSSDKAPIEYQADRFASCLLMPVEMIRRNWHEWQGNSEPIYLTDLRAEGDVRSDATILEDAIRPLADHFQVSSAAMRIRLEAVGLLKLKKEALLF